MAVKRYCDVCGTEIEIVYNRVDLREAGCCAYSFDVCKDCLVKVKQLLIGKNKESFKCLEQ